MKFVLAFIMLCLAQSIVAQRDSIPPDSRYSEDQLYISVTYNQLFDQPDNIASSGFSYGFSSGYINDISLNKKGTIALGVGLGYAYNSFNHGLQVTEVNNQITFEVANSSATNKLFIHTLEFPLELRWRTSTANKYKFWRIYTGIKFGYNLANTFEYAEGGNTFSYKNVSRYNKWSYGFTLSAGFDAFNAYMYYGLKPLLKDTTIGTTDISTKMLKIGLIFYFL